MGEGLSETTHVSKRNISDSNIEAWKDVKDILLLKRECYRIHELREDTETFNRKKSMMMTTMMMMMPGIRFSWNFIQKSKPQNKVKEG